MSLARPPMPPSLSLSDIMHPMSPPPRERPPNSPVVETLHDQEIAQMRAKALRMGLDTDQNTDATPRERELFDMVLRLTNPNTPPLDPAQLVIQAETIAGLVHQRDYLTHRIEEERLMWESEKAGWDRMAEALIVQRNRKVNGPEDSELQRMCNSLEFDNKSLKEKLDHTQGRITALEAEISKLKPHLLLQPFVPRPTQRSTTTMTQQPATTTSQQSATTLQQPPTTMSQPLDTLAPNSHLPPQAEMETEDVSPDAPPSQPHTIEAAPQIPKDITTVDTPPTIPPEQSPRPVLQPPTLHALAQASAYFASLPFPSLQNVSTIHSRTKKLAATLKKSLQPGAHVTQTDSSVFPPPPPGTRTVLNAVSQPPPPPPQRKSRHGKARRAPPQLMVSDARAEHLLIAARRIGRERAGLVAGVISAERERMEREKADQEKERLEMEKERLEREKRNRGGGGGYYRERPDHAPRAMSGVDHTKHQNTSTSNGIRYANAMAGYVHAAGAPAKSDAPKAKRKNVPTPLDSLFNAARSMLDGGPEENENGGAGPSASTTSVSTGMMTRRRAANANETPQMEGSAPKRRRLSSNASAPPARARTALDVLADQAAVFSSSKGTGGGQGDELVADSVVPPTKRKRGRPPNKDRNKFAPAPTTPSNSSRSPAPVAGPSRQGIPNPESTNNSTSDIGMNPRPATKWVQRGRLASSASSRAPPRQKDDLESEDEEEEEMDDAPPATETDKPYEPVPQGETLDPAVRATAPATPRPVIDDAVPLAVRDSAVSEGQPPRPLPSPPSAEMQLEDPVLDADADGESDPDIDMEATGL